MLALKVNKLRKTHNPQEPQAEKESPENSSRPEVKDEPLDRTAGAESGSPSLQEADVLDPLNTGSETNTLDTEKLPQEPNLDQQRISTQDLSIIHESDECNDYFWTLDALTAKRAEEQKRASEERLRLQAQASKAQALEQQNTKLSEELKNSRSTCEHLQEKIRDLELEMTNNSTEHNMVKSLQEDLQREREKLISVNEKLSDLRQEFHHKDTELRQKLEKASQEKVDLQAQVQEGQTSAVMLQSLLSSMEVEVQQVKDMKLKLERHNDLLKQKNVELSKDLKQVKSKQSSIEESFQHLVQECECLQEKNRELELEQAHNSTNRSFITRLEEDLKTERAQLTAVVKKLSDVRQEFHHKETELREKLEKVSKEKLDLQAQVQEGQTSAMILQKTQSLLSSMEAEVQQVKDMKLKLERHNDLLKQKNVELSKDLKQMKSKQSSIEESFQHLVYECECLQEKNRELELEQADNSTNCSIIIRLGEDLKTERAQLTAVNKKLSDVRQEFHHKETELKEKLEKVSKEKVDLQAQVQEGQTSAVMLQKTQSLLSSMEAEVQQVKDMKLKLERQNDLLRRENVELSTELHQVKTKQSSTDESFQHLLYESECLQEVIRELELEQADNSTNRSIITRLEEDLKTERAQLTAVNKKLSDLKQEFHHKDTELREKLEKVSKEKVDLQAQVQEDQTSAVKLQETQSLLSSMEVEVQQVKDVNLELERQNKLLEQEKLKISAELHQVKTKQSSTEESFQRLLFETLRPKINETELEQADKSTNGSKGTSIGKDPQTEWEQLIAINETVSALMQVLRHKELRLVKELEKAFKEIVALKAQVNKDKSSLQELQKIRSLLSSMESELHQVREMNLELKAQNTLLEQENAELFTELNEAKTRLDSAEDSFQHLAHECECPQGRNPQSDWADSGTNGNEKPNLQTESATKNDNQAVLELLQRLLLTRLPKHKDDATISCLEKNNKGLTDMSLSLKGNKQKNTPGHGKKHAKKLQRQVSTTPANSQVVSHLLQQLNVRLTDRVSECKRTKEELINTQQANQRLTEELYCVLLEYNRVNQKYNEDQMKCETMLCQAEHKFNKETARLSSTIQALRKEVNRLTSLLTEEKERFLEYRMELGPYRELSEAR